MPDEWSFILKISYFIARNKIFLKRMALFLLFFIDILIVAAFSTMFLNYQSDTLLYQEVLWQLTHNNLDYAYLNTISRPQPLEVLKTHIIKNTDGRFDFVALVKNKNINWRAPSLEYRFVWNKGGTEYFKSFLLPGQDKYLMAFKQDAARGISAVQVEFRHVAWQRVERSDLLDNLGKLQATEAKINITSDGNSRLLFKANNNSAYSFWTVGWQVVVFRQSRAVAANYVFVNNLKSRDARDISLVWLERLETNDTIDIKPDVDLFDEKSFMKPDS